MRNKGESESILGDKPPSVRPPSARSQRSRPGSGRSGSHRGEPGTAASIQTWGKVAEVQGVSAANGQLHQAKDRNFEATFERCSRACDLLLQTTATATFCQQAQRELDDLVRHIEGMLEVLRPEFHSQTARTIVSLKQLVEQIEHAVDVSERHASAPGGFLWCGKKEGARRRGDQELKEATKTLQAYSAALLLEHGRSPGELFKYTKAARGSSIGDSPQKQTPNGNAAGARGRTPG